jgi:hypothetical protein
MEENKWMGRIKELEEELRLKETELSMYRHELVKSESVAGKNYSSIARRVARSTTNSAFAFSYRNSKHFWF